MLVLSEQDLNSLNLTTVQIVDSLERLICAQRESRAWAAPKSVIAPPDGRYLMSTLSASSDPPLMAVKSLGLNPRNPEKGLRAINASIALLDSETGLTKAVMDGTWITAVRTACASAVAAKRLARADSFSVAFIGCGVQANSHLQAFSEIFPLAEIRAFGRGRENRDSLCQTAEDQGLRAIPCESAEQAVSGADLVVSSIPLTAKVPPFIDAGWLKKGVFLAATDMALPFFPESLSVFDRIVIDDMEQEANMPDPMAPIELIHGDITSLVMNEIKGRESDEEKNAFIFRAVALGDLALATLAYETAMARSIGTHIDL